MANRSIIIYRLQAVQSINLIVLDIRVSHESNNQQMGKLTGNHMKGFGAHHRRQHVTGCREYFSADFLLSKLTETYGATNIKLIKLRGHVVPWLLR